MAICRVVPRAAAQIGAYLLVILAARAMPVAQSGPLVLTGIVIDAGTHQPIAHAVVTLDGGSPEAVRQPNVAPRRVLTNDSGQWLFRDLAPGPYSISAIAGGYLKGAAGQRRPDGDGQRIDIRDADRHEGLAISLWRAGAISGTVLDEDGDPVVNTGVAVVRRLGRFGLGPYVQVATATTDDRGMYRVSPLSPASDYVVGAARQTLFSSPVAAANAALEAIAGGSSFEHTQTILRDYQSSGVYNPASGGMRIGDSIVLGGTLNEFDLMPPAPGADGRLRIFQRAFFHGPSSPSAAESVRLSSGEERTWVDLQLRLVTTVHVSGTVTDANGPVGGIGIALAPAGADQLAFATGTVSDVVSTLTDPSGAFRFPAVPPGAYQLRVLKVATVQTANQIEMPEGPTLWAAMPLTVADADIDGLSLTLRMGMRLTGRIVFDGTSPPPTAAEIRVMAITLIPTADQLRQPPAPGRAASDGRFSTMGYPAGKYLVSVSSPNSAWTLTSVTAQGHDVSAVPLSLTDGDVDATITFTDHPATLSGAAHTESGALDPDATVVVFPANYEGWIANGASARLGREARVDASGAFHIRGLPSGDYFAVALRDEDAGNWSDVKTLAALARSATRITIGASESRSVELRTMSTR